MKRLTLPLFVLAASLIPQAPAQSTRGIGVYPGDPSQYTGPTLVVDASTYRNLALHRPAYQSSSYDYNLTAQLITDGIREPGRAVGHRRHKPAGSRRSLHHHVHFEQWHSSQTRAGSLPRRQRHFVD